MSSTKLVWELIKRGKDGNNVGASTGLKKLDKIIGGLQPNRYILVSAASSVGKTSFVVYILYNLLKNMKKDEPVYLLYFSLEIGEDILLSKLMSLYCAENFGIYLSTNDILSFERPLDDYSYRALEKAKEWLDSLSENLEILDNGLTSSSLYKETCKFAQKHGYLDENKHYIPNNPKQRLMACIDHFALIRPSDGNNLKQEIDLASSYIVTLKRKFQMAWFVLMQQNRESSSMDRRKADLSEPGLQDIKDSAAPSQDSDITLQLFWPYREKLTSYRDYRILGDSGIGSCFRSVIISKNRYGVANQVIGMSFYGSVGWFNELPPGKEISDFTIYKSEQNNIPCKHISLNTNQLNYNF